MPEKIKNRLINLQCSDDLIVADMVMTDGYSARVSFWGKPM